MAVKIGNHYNYLCNLVKIPHALGAAIMVEKFASDTQSDKSISVLEKDPTLRRIL